jgi:uncharacterized repeat protein (TIGR02543 family)
MAALLCVSALLNVVAATPASATGVSWSPQEFSLGSSFGSAGYFNSISCTSATACTAVGQDDNSEPFILTGNPATWTASNATEIALGSSFASSGTLYAISCTSATSCTAVGNDGHNQPLAFTGDPSSWTVSNATEIALGSSFGSQGYPQAISCTSTTTCTAAGYDGHNQPFALTGNPSTWTASNATEIALGSSFGSQGSLYAISCTSATACTAAGQDGNNEPLVLTGNPSTWNASNATEIALGSGFSGAGDLQGISCTSATKCTAVGSDGNSRSLILTGDPSSWTAINAYEVTLGSSFGSPVELYAISCTSATSCTAVAGDGHHQPFTLIGDPSSWTVSNASETTLGSGFGNSGYLLAVSCTSATTCTAAGGDGHSEPIILTSSVSNPVSHAATYPVSYVVGGGTGTLPTQVSEASGATFTVASGASLSRLGYTFSGWNDGTTTYQAGATYTIGSTPITLTAQWAVVTYAVTYLLHGGIGALPTQISEANSATFTVASGASLSRLGYTFAGWNDGTTTYQAGATYTIGVMPITLAAQWTLKVHPTCVVYFANNSDQISSAFTAELMKFARSLKTSDLTSIRVVGFADPTGTPSSNKTLSLHRAQDVAATLRTEFKTIGLHSVLINVVAGGVTTRSNTPARDRMVVTSS